MGERHVSSAASTVVVKLRDRMFGFDVHAVTEMATLSDVRVVPQVPACVRGVIDLRGHVLTVVDLRRRLGMPTAAEELNELLAIFEAREADHRNWIEALDAAIVERREFTLATDPHRCAFGRWYDSLKTDDIVLAAQLKKIDGPHQRIHRRGADALACAAAGRHEEASAISREIRSHELATTLALFSETRKMLRETQREVAVVVRQDLGGFAVAVDGVEAVERLSPVEACESTAGLLAEAPGRLVSDVRRRSRDGQLVLIVDLARVMEAA